MSSKDLHAKTTQKNEPVGALGYRWILFHQEADGLKPVLKGSGVSVKLVALLFLQGLTAQKIACYFGLPLPAVREALEYTKTHGDIDLGVANTTYSSPAHKRRLASISRPKSSWPHWMKWIMVTQK